MERSIVHNGSNKTFELIVEGHEAKIDYFLKDNTIIITSTWVPKKIGGRGVAAALTRYALEYAKQNGLKVIPKCAYTQAYIKRHEEYSELL